MSLLEHGSEPTLADVYFLLGEVSADVKEVKSKVRDHETRIRSVERLRNIIGGAGAFITAGIAAWKGLH